MRKIEENPIVKSQLASTSIHVKLEVSFMISSYENLYIDRIKVGYICY